VRRRPDVCRDGATDEKQENDQERVVLRPLPALPQALPDFLAYRLARDRRALDQAAARMCPARRHGR
jgi:hypothetical protein